MAFPNSDRKGVYLKESSIFYIYIKGCISPGLYFSDGLSMNTVSPHVTFFLLKVQYTK